MAKKKPELQKVDSPAIYKDPKTGKVYYATSFYGSIGDIYKMATKPVETAANKVNPFAKEGVAQLFNYDTYTKAPVVDTNASAIQQLAQRFSHAASNLVSPAGSQDLGKDLIGANKTPGVVQLSKAVGLGGSTSSTEIYSSAKSLVDAQTAANTKMAQQIKAGDQAGAQVTADQFNKMITSKSAELAKNPDVTQTQKDAITQLPDKLKLSPYPTSGKPSGDPLAGLIDNIGQGNKTDIFNGDKAFKTAGGSSLTYMQAQKLGGSNAYDKFFAANPNLDPTSKSFNGKLADSNAKNTDVLIKAGFDTAKQKGQSLAYMQSIKESGSTYFDKFFATHQNLDPTSQNYTPKATSSQKYAAKGAKYAMKTAEARGKSTFKVKAPKGVAKVSATKLFGSSRIKGVTTAAAPRTRATKTIKVGGLKLK